MSVGGCPDTHADLGLNVLDRTVSLTRGDGLVGIHDSAHDVNFGQVYEVAGKVSLTVFGTAHFTAGYNAVWLLGVAKASEQVDFDLSHTTGQSHNNGQVFYHGPSAEIVFTF